MSKRFKVLGLSLGIIVLGSGVANAANSNSTYKNFTNYKVDSNFHDTYSKRDYKGYFHE